MFYIIIEHDQPFGIKILSILVCYLTEMWPTDLMESMFCCRSNGCLRCINTVSVRRSRSFDILLKSRGGLWHSHSIKTVLHNGQQKSLTLDKYKYLPPLTRCVVWDMGLQYIAVDMVWMGYGVWRAARVCAMNTGVHKWTYNLTESRLWLIHLNIIIFHCMDL